MSRRRHRFLAPLLVLAFCATQLGVAMHAPEAAHRVCEHGQLVDEPAAEHAAVPATPHDQLHAAGQPGESGREHEHCVFATVLQQNAQVTGVDALASVAPPAAQDIATPAPRAPGLITLAIYRLAPKTSPPA